VALLPPVGWEDGPAPESVWTRWRKTETSAPTENWYNPPVIRPVAWSLYQVLLTHLLW